ncbi:MAG: hypothetical protein ACRDLF_00615 [Solirubrobacteraceae bacterium]
MESSPHAHDTDTASDKRISPKGIEFDGAEVRGLVRSIVKHPAVKDATVEVALAGLSDAAEEHLREGVRAGANEVLASLSDALRDGVKDTLDALSEEDWTLIAREMLEDAKGKAEAAAVA